MSVESKKLSDIYGKGYFFGQGSGYPPAGYHRTHPTWEEYLGFIQSIKGSRLLWLDIGCAYGYLLKEAGERGISAYGVDVSTFALEQLPEVRSRLVRGLANDLPFPSEFFNVVTAFDLVEHLPEPATGLAEMVRVLKPEGVLVFSTPDPLFFKREEETHISEHPPSFWLDQIRRLGLRSRLRFYGEPYNLEILAIKAGDEIKARPLWEGFNRDYLGQRPDILRASPGNCQVVLRQGWSELREKTSGQRVRCFGKKASLYFHNGGKVPIEVKLEMVLSREAPLKLNTHLERIAIESARREEGAWRFMIDLFYLPPGGHELEVQCEDEEQVEIRDIEVHFSEQEFSYYNLALPIDQYQRYRILQQSLGLLEPKRETSRILEVGGAPGQILGFLPHDDITIADVEACDVASFHRADGLSLPFADGSFDIVVSIDALEHITPENRETFLSELLRVSGKYVFLGAPFAGQALEEAERILFEFIHTKLHVMHRFLHEHLRHSLPDQEATDQFLKSQGLRTIILPNGFLSHWLLMMLANFYLEADPRLNRVKRRINQYYNTHHYPLDNRSPAYRHLLVGWKHSLPEERCEALKSLALPPEKKISANLTPAALLLELVNLDLLEKKDGIIGEKDRVIGEKDKAIGNLITHSENLEKIIRESDKAVQDLVAHSENLAKVISAKDASIQSLSEGLSDLETRFLASLEQNSFLMGRVDELEASLDNYVRRTQELDQHARNLELIVHHPLVKAMRACKKMLKFGR